MTREEARKELCLAQADVWYRPSDDAIDMAIEALELVTSYEDTIYKLTEAIANTQEPKTGHWIGVDQYPHEDYECDMCGYVVYADDDTPNKYNYCPYCGAKMESEVI